MSVDYDYHRRTSYSTTSVTGNNRSPSLREMPSFRDEASKALNRREELQKLKERLSFNRDILHADPSSKPWLRKPSVPIRSSPGRDTGLVNPSSAGVDQLYSLHTASPAHVLATPDEISHVSETGSSPAVPPRPRNLSRGTSASADSSEGSYAENAYYDY